MPIYSYKCANGHTFEKLQGMNEDAVSECPDCKSSAKRVLGRVSIRFRGKGFHNTDYPVKQRA